MTAERMTQRSCDDTTRCDDQRSWMTLRDDPSGWHISCDDNLRLMTVPDDTFHVMTIFDWWPRCGWHNTLWWPFRITHFMWWHRAAMMTPKVMTIYDWWRFSIDDEHVRWPLRGASSGTVITKCHRLCRHPSKKVITTCCVITQSVFCNAPHFFNYIYVINYIKWV